MKAPHKVALIVVLVAAAFAAGFLIRGAGTPASTSQPAGVAKPAPTLWTCSMHPQIIRSEKGNCPICGMELVPLTSHEGATTDRPRALSVSDAAKALMDIRTSPVERRRVAVEVRLTGKVAYDETRLADITAWVGGRLDRLYVDYTGVTVKKGDHMVYMYSPELLSAQEELLESIRAAKALERSDVKVLADGADRTVDAARERLRLWGLTPEQIKETEARGTASDHLTIYAPIGGIVIHKYVRQGAYVTTGARIYTIADLAHVWVLLDAYESDLPWLRYGQEVDITTEAYPGEVFRGRIAFIDPVVNPRTRTVRVRVNVANERFRLKPDMFVRAVVHSKLAAGGRVMAADLAGKWICPMHPEIVKDEPGACDVCGMPLVRPESLGYEPVSAEDAPLPLVVPATAPLLTGKRAIVYVEVPDAAAPTFEGREVTLGPRAGEYYIVQSGLTEGERVVTHGAFKIDSELQIRALPSMMSPEGGHAPGRHAHHGAQGKPPADATPPAPPGPSAEVTQAAAALWRAYLAIQRALARDDFDRALASARTLAGTLDAIDASSLEGRMKAAWSEHAGAAKKALAGMAQSTDIASLREGFALLSEALAPLFERFGGDAVGAVYVIRCPMAFNNRGANWLQDSSDVRNPYFGPTMLRCGDVVRTMRAPSKQGDGGHAHE